MEHVNDILKEYGDQLQSEADETVATAIRLFYKLPAHMGLTLAKELGFKSGMMTKDELKEVLEVMELTDDIIPLIATMRKVVGYAP